MTIGDMKMSCSATAPCTTLGQNEHTLKFCATKS